MKAQTKAQILGQLPKLIMGREAFLAHDATSFHKDAEEFCKGKMAICIPTTKDAVAAHKIVVDFHSEALWNRHSVFITTEAEDEPNKLFVFEATSAAKSFLKKEAIKHDPTLAKKYAPKRSKKRATRSSTKLADSKVPFWTVFHIVVSAPNAKSLRMWKQRVRGFMHPRFVRTYTLDSTKTVIIGVRGTRIDSKSSLPFIQSFEREGAEVTQFSLEDWNSQFEELTIE